jgi:gluconate 2-dehydrogenase gamma chain
MTASDQKPAEAAMRRRSLLTGLVTAVPAAALAQTAAGPPVGPASTPPAVDPCQFLNPQERRALEAMAARIMPEDDLGPGAVEAGAVVFMDRQLAGAWGAGAHFYKSGPFVTGTPQQGYQLPLTPAEMFREGLAQMDAAATKLHGHPFADATPEQQDAMMTAMHEGKFDLGPLPSNIFVNAVVEATLEGFFSDPLYGGNKDMAGWKLVGFPGAYDSYAQEIERYGLEWRRAPVPMQADADLGMNPGMPGIICETR